MDIMDVLYFPAETALAAMGNTSKRWQSHLEQGKIDVETHQHAIKSSGPGRGKKREISLEAIAQGAIALALIDAGVNVREAYRVGACFAYSGGFQGKILTDPTAPIDPARDRHAGRLFGHGQTILVFTVGSNALTDEKTAIISDADPAFAGFEGVSQISLLIDATCGPDEAPRIFINLSVLCERICDELHLNCTAVFGGGVV